MITRKYQGLGLVPAARRKTSRDLLNTGSTSSSQVLVLTIMMVVGIHIHGRQKEDMTITDNMPFKMMYVNLHPQEGLVVSMVGKPRKYSMEQADIPNIRFHNLPQL